jgi:hypothetical protein
MDWIAAVIAAFSGAIAALIAQLAVGLKKERKGLYLISLFLIFTGLEFCGRSYVGPWLHAWEAERQVREIPFYKELSVHDPEAYQRIKTIIREAVRSGDSQTKISLRIADVIGGIFPRYLPKASDDSVVAFANSMVHLLEQLDHANSDACYASLFPHKFGEPGMAQKYEDLKTQKEVLDTMKDIVESAINNPQAEPDPKKSEELLQPIIETMAKKYGADVTLLQGTAHDSSERKKVCEMSSEMFRQVRSLPKADASMILRYLLSGKE